MGYRKGGKVMYQVCFDIDIPEFHCHETRVCYETDTEYDARCYIGEMHMLGDYSNYYIRKVGE